MGERARLREVKPSVVGLGAIVAFFGLKKSVEHFRDTAEKRKQAYGEVIQSIEGLLAGKGDTSGPINSENGILAVTRSSQDTPKYKVEIVCNYGIGGQEMTASSLYETDGVTGSKKDITTTRLVDPSIDPPHLWKEKDSAWTAPEALTIAAELIRLGRVSEAAA